MSSESILPKLMKSIEELEGKPCKSFPFHTICNEVIELHFDNWCEPCQARHLRKFFDKHSMYSTDTEGTDEVISQLPLG